MNKRLLPLLVNEIRLWVRSVVAIQLAMLLGVYFLLLIAVAQIPLTYHIQIGQPDAVGSDLPLVQGFYAAADSPSGRFRWSAAQSFVLLPGFGVRPLALQLRILPVSQQALEAVNTAEVWSANRLVAPLPLRLSGATYHILLPVDGTDQQFAIRSRTFRAVGDARTLGVPVGTLTAKRFGFAWPSMGMANVVWLLVLTLGWATIRRIGWSVADTRRMLLFGIAILSVCSLLDPPRTTLGALPFVIAVAWAGLLVLLLQHLLPRVYARMAIPFDRGGLRWLLLLGFVVFVLRYAGKIYPESMPGDLSFHANRFAELLGGRVLLQAPHRGVIAPYPPAFYVLLAPLTLSGIGARQLLHFSVALIDACSPLIVYGITRMALRGSQSRQVALVSAAFYALAPAGMLVSWWNFSTYIFAQAAQLVLIAAILAGLRSQEMNPQFVALAAKSQRVLSHNLHIGRKPTFATLAVLVVLSLLVYLGHFSYYLNASLLLGGATLFVILWGVRGRIEHQTVFRISSAALISQVIVALLFFSFYIQALRGQANAVESGVAVALLADPQALAGFIESILTEGLRDHLGLFPVLLALSGVVWYMLGWKRLTPVGATLLLGTLLIAAGFGLLPLVSAANLTTRWLTFALWAVGVMGAPIAILFWRTGRAGRFFTAIIGLYLLWVSAAIWLGAFAWRIRPPEPF